MTKIKQGLWYQCKKSHPYFTEGDYYWDSNTARHRDCWVSVDKTYSAHKPGEKIGSVNWYGRVLTEPIIIRKYER